MQTATISQTMPFHALGDETRLRVMRLLVVTAGPLTAGQLAESIGVPPSHLSRHLQILEFSGLISRARRGKTHYICTSNAHPVNLPLFDAVQAIADDAKVFSQDLERLGQILGYGQNVPPYSDADG